jgi:hypothetical protein
MPRSSAAYGAIGVSLILCANVVIIVICLGFGCKDSENRVKYTILIVNLIKIFRIAFISEMQPIFERELKDSANRAKYQTSGEEIAKFLTHT